MRAKGSALPMLRGQVYSKVSSSWRKCFSYLSRKRESRQGALRKSEQKLLFVAVARQICFVWYRVSLLCKQRSQPKRSLTGGGGGHENVNAAKKRVQKCHSLQKRKVISC